jgi:hypothetical protein
VNPDETTPPVDGLIDALQQHHWPVAVGLAIALAIHAANRANLLKNVPSKYTPVLAAVLGIVSAIGAQLATGMGWEEAIGKGFLAGAAATGFWEMALKHVLKFPMPAVDAPASVEPEKAEAPSPVPAKAEEPTKAEAPVKKARKSKAASNPTEVASTAASDSASAAPPAPEPTPVSEAPAPPKKRGRPRKNPESAS